MFRCKLQFRVQKAARGTNYRAALLMRACLLRSLRQHTVSGQHIDELLFLSFARSSGMTLEVDNSRLHPCTQRDRSSDLLLPLQRCLSHGLMVTLLDTRTARSSQRQGDQSETEFIPKVVMPTATAILVAGRLPSVSPKSSTITGVIRFRVLYIGMLSLDSDIKPNITLAE